jgi:hypothetical protein
MRLGLGLIVTAALATCFPASAKPVNPNDGFSWFLRQNPEGNDPKALVAMYGRPDTEALYTFECAKDGSSVTLTRWVDSDAPYPAIIAVGRTRFKGVFIPSTEEGLGNDNVNIPMSEPIISHIMVSNQPISINGNMVRNRGIIKRLLGHCYELALGKG